MTMLTCGGAEVARDERPDPELWTLHFGGLAIVTVIFLAIVAIM